MTGWREYILKVLIACISAWLVAGKWAEDEIDTTVGPSAHYAELELDTFRRKVFSDEKDYVVLIYYANSGKTQDLFKAHEKAAMRIKRRAEKVGLKDKIAFGRLDIRVFGEGTTWRKLPEFETGGNGVPRMLLLRAGEKTPVRVPDEDLGYHDDSTALYDWIRKTSSFKAKLLKKKEFEDLEEEAEPKKGSTETGTESDYSEL